jgi:hypothetical protein
MAMRRKPSTTRRPAARRRTTRRRSMGQAFSAASVKAASMIAVNGALGGAAAAILTNVIGDNLGQFKPYTGLLGAFATSVFLKRPELAAGMAGYAGAKVIGTLVGSTSDIGKLLANDYESGGSNYYLQGYEVPMMGGSNIYASDYTLSENFIPGL